MNIGVYIKCIPKNILLNTKENSSTKNEIQYMINPFDEYAIEEALKYKDKYQETNIILITIGGDYANECLRKALAMGATSAVLVQKEDYSVYDNTIESARIIKNIIEMNNIDFVLMGKESIDDQKTYLSAMIGAFLNWPHINNIINIDYQDSVLNVTRVFNNSLKEIIALKTPCLVSVLKGINQPRYPSVMNIMKAKNKPIQKHNYQDFFPKDNNGIYIKKLYYPETKRSNIIDKNDDVQLSAKNLINYLKDEIKIIKE